MLRHHLFGIPLLPFPGIVVGPQKGRPRKSLRTRFSLCRPTMWILLRAYRTRADRQSRYSFGILAAAFSTFLLTSERRPCSPAHVRAVDLSGKLPDVWFPLECRPAHVQRVFQSCTRVYQHLQKSRSRVVVRKIAVPPATSAD